VYERRLKLARAMSWRVRPSVRGGEGSGAEQVSRTEHGGAAGGTDPSRAVRPCGDALGPRRACQRGLGVTDRHGQAAAVRAARARLWSHFHRAVNSAGLCLAGKGLRARGAAFPLYKATARTQIQSRGCSSIYCSANSTRRARTYTKKHAPCLPHREACTWSAAPVCMLTSI